MERAMDAFNIEDYATVRRTLTPLAIIGDRTAGYYLGMMHAYGLGTPRNRGEAFKWLRRSELWSRQGTERALMEAYYFGEDFAKGRHPLSKDEVEAVEWFKTAAEAGSREAAERLAKAYTVGDLGLPRDQGRAEYWQRKAQ